MQGGFERFKRRIWRDIAIKCSVAGISGAMIAVGVVLLACKLTETNLVFSILGFLGLAAGGVLFLFLRTNDVKTAKLLDEHFRLDERVQTMVEYRDAEGPVVQAQREDTQRRLSELSVKELPFGRLWIYIVVAVLATAMFITALAIPAKFTPTEEEEELPPLYEVSDWEWAALDELIIYVQDSGADGNMKTRILTALNSLRKRLLDGVSSDSLSGFVSATVSEVNAAFVDSTTNVGAEQNAVNEEVKNYVVAKLYEIFSLQVEADEEPETGSSSGDGTDVGSGGSGNLTMGTEESVYDPQRGYIKYKEIIGEYYAEIERALLNGEISEEEWGDYISAYFGYLYYGTEE